MSDDSKPCGGRCGGAHQAGWHYSLKPNLILRQWHNHRASSAMTMLLLKRASVSRPSGKWNEDDYDVLADDEVIGRIY
jgi:hypothetical protein